MNIGLKRLVRMVTSISFTRCLCYKPERFIIISLSLPTQANYNNTWLRLRAFYSEKSVLWWPKEYKRNNHGKSRFRNDCVRKSRLKFVINGTPLFSFYNNGDENTGHY